MLEDFSHVNEGEQIREDFSPEQMMALDISQFPRYEDTVKLIVCEHYSPGSTTQQKKKLIMMPMVDYVRKQVEAVTLPSNDLRVVIKFIKKHIFTRFGTPRSIISDEGKCFINNLFKTLLAKYDIRHKVVAAYQSQMSVYVEVSDREVKKLLQKMVNAQRKEWYEKFNDALWAYMTAYKMRIGNSP
ncbi:uncharacterized protein [Solanum lycopersicum]|uniref:uncharacterized protein n=1 Tax=Solanum lycopersicum TaxID=4081 RepID=UPI003747A290